MDYDTASANWRYDPETGILYWLKQKPRIPKNMVAGGAKADGSIQVGLAGRRYFAHRIAWVLMTGKEAPGMIDHINGNPSDNRWANLRVADPIQNQANLNKTPAGVVVRPYGRFEAHIRVNKKKKHLGVYGSFEEARKVYESAHRQLHGEFSCFNRPVAV